jgi:hypothetical protein
MTHTTLYRFLPRLLNLFVSARDYRVDDSTVRSLPEEFTMSSMTWRRLGACAILVASLVATGGTAIAKVTIACKQHLQVSGGTWPSEAQAIAAAEKSWAIAALNKYGHAWASLANAKNKHLNCFQLKGGSWKCSLSAQACAPMKPPSASQAQPGVPPNQAATERLPPSNSRTRTTAPGGRTSIIDQPSGVMQFPGVRPGQRAPAISPGIGGPRR